MEFEPPALPRTFVCDELSSWDTEHSLLSVKAVEEKGTQRSPQLLPAGQNTPSTRVLSFSPQSLSRHDQFSQRWCWQLLRLQIALHSSE